MKIPLIILCSIFLAPVSVFAEESDSERAMKMVVAEHARLNRQMRVLGRLVSEHNRAVAEIHDLTDQERKRLEEIREIERPFGKAMGELIKAHRDGLTIADFPGILGLGTINTDQRTQLYHLDIFFRYDSRDGPILSERFIRFTISFDGKIVKIGPAPNQATS